MLFRSLRPEATARLLLRLAENQAEFCRAVAKAGLDIAFFESAAAPPLLSPRQFHQLELPALRRILALASECLGHPVPCIMGGNTHPILADLLATGTTYLACNVETDQKAFVESLSRTHPHVRLRVNLDPAVVASSELERMHAGVDRVLEIIGDRSNCLIGTGALPFETPPGNVRLIREYLAGRASGQPQSAML